MDGGKRSGMREPKARPGRTGELDLGEGSARYCGPVQSVLE